MCQGANCSELCVLIDRSLESSQVRCEVLRKPERLMPIVNCVLARKRLKEYACQNLDRRRAVKARSFIVEIMQKSGGIWRGGNPPPPPDIYEEALVRSWEWFSEQLCSYEPERASFITWFNQNLRYKILDVTRKQQTEEDRRYQPPETKDDTFDLDLWDRIPIDKLPERILPSDLEYASILYEQLIELVKRDIGGTLHMCYMQQHIHVSCQRLILRILEMKATPPSIPWDQLAGEFEVAREQLRQFYRNKCRPCFKNFLMDNGIYN